MGSTKQKIKTELAKLFKEGLQIVVNETDMKVIGLDIKKQENHESFSSSYNTWYSKCLPVIQTILPERLEDFKSYYKSSKTRKTRNFENYTISDYLIQLPVTIWKEDKSNTKKVLSIKFNNQISIIKAALECVDYVLRNLEGLLQADLFDGEIEAARELFNKKYYRASGVLAGVVLEKHLKNVVNSHKIKIVKKKPTLTVFNNTLKENSIYEIPTWRQIQSLGDIRNICAHGSDREPKKLEVEELINGVEKVIKNIF